ncbi:hypothetical protein GGR57DRAFT_516067 [Xylariaceae sp. FL1272]|nr:hypothetical protein GGR57DRAFT_516067 [Xylariaceae sp. FL1272]
MDTAKFDWTLPCQRALFNALEHLAKTPKMSLNRAIGCLQRDLLDNDNPLPHGVVAEFLLKDTSGPLPEAFQAHAGRQEVQTRLRDALGTLEDLFKDSFRRYSTRHLTVMTYRLYCYAHGLASSADEPSSPTISFDDWRSEAGLIDFLLDICPPPSLNLAPFKTQMEEVIANLGTNENALIRSCVTATRINSSNTSEELARDFFRASSEHPADPRAAVHLLGLLPPCQDTPMRSLPWTGL